MLGGDSIKCAICRDPGRVQSRVPRHPGAPLPGTDVNYFTPLHTTQQLGLEELKLREAERVEIEAGICAAKQEVNIALGWMDGWKFYFHY